VPKSPSLDIWELKNNTTTLPGLVKPKSTKDFEGSRQKRALKSISQNLWSFTNSSTSLCHKTSDLKAKSRAIKSYWNEVSARDILSNSHNSHRKSPAVYDPPSDGDSNSDSEVFRLNLVTPPDLISPLSKDYDSGQCQNGPIDLKSKPQLSSQSLSKDTSLPVLSPKLGWSWSKNQQKDQTSKSDSIWEVCNSEFLRQLAKKGSLADEKPALEDKNSGDKPFQSKARSNIRFSGLLKRSTASCLDDEEYFLELREERSTNINSKCLLSGILESTPESNRGTTLQRILSIVPGGSRTFNDPEHCTVISPCDGSKSLYFERLRRQATTLRRSQHKHKRKWGTQTHDTVLKEINIVGDVMGKRTYWRAFRFNKGRTNPWKELVLSLIWTTIFLCLHKNYLDLGTKLFGRTIDPWFSNSFINYFTVALGFLLYMQAGVSSERWWEGRVHWQLIIEKSKRLAVLLNTHVDCLRLSRTGTRMIEAYIICARCFMQDYSDSVWRVTLSELLDDNRVDEIMMQPRRLRSLCILYGLQRLICVCIDYRILSMQVIRDINPIIMSMGRSLDICNRVRTTKLPLVIAMHLQLMLLVYVAFLPMVLVGALKYSQWEFVPLTKISYIDIYIYVIITAYAFFGLSRMALDIDNPFSFTRENHSFGFWGFYEYWSSEERKNLRSIFGLRSERVGRKEINCNGLYGMKWDSSKLRPLVEAAIECEPQESSNLYGRTEQIRQQLLINSRTLSNFSNLCLTATDRDCSLITLGSCSWSGTLDEVQCQARRSSSDDQGTNLNKKTLKNVARNFTITLPTTPTYQSRESLFQSRHRLSPETQENFGSIIFSHEVCSPSSENQPGSLENGGRFKNLDD